jgi:hypothetical protein
MAARSRPYRCLLDLEGDRIRDMEEKGVDVGHTRIESKVRYLG